MEIYEEEFSTPVLLAHGTFGCSSHWICNLRNESSGFLLADEGYDVWIMNRRANSFSNKKRIDGVLQDPKAEDYYTAV